jgi:hypothetical protein
MGKLSKAILSRFFVIPIPFFRITSFADPRPFVLPAFTGIFSVALSLSRALRSGG